MCVFVCVWFFLGGGVGAAGGGGEVVCLACFGFFSSIECS